MEGGGLDAMSLFLNERALNFIFWDLSSFGLDLSLSISPRTMSPAGSGVNTALTSLLFIRMAQASEKVVTREEGAVEGRLERREEDASMKIDAVNMRTNRLLRRVWVCVCVCVWFFFFFLGLNLFWVFNLVFFCCASRRSRHFSKHRAATARKMLATLCELVGSNVRELMLC